MKHNPMSANPMYVQVRKGSPAEVTCEANRQMALGHIQSPATHPDDLIFHGGRTVAQMRLQTVYVGPRSDWKDADITAIDMFGAFALQDQRLNAGMAQYFDGVIPSCHSLPSVLADTPRLDATIAAEAAEQQLLSLYADSRLDTSDLDNTLFALLMPPSTVLAWGETDSVSGLGGFHSSIRVRQGDVRLYYCVIAFSEALPDGRENGVSHFDVPWKNVVASLSHLANEFRTNPDVADAIRSGERNLLGWVSATGLECGDLPLATATSTADVLKELPVSGGPFRCPVQLRYSNAVHGTEPTP